jgi:hypothetical protein
METIALENHLEDEKCSFIIELLTTEQTRHLLKIPMF